MEHIMRTADHNRGLCLVVLPDRVDASVFQPDGLHEFLSQVYDTLKIPQSSECTSSPDTL